MRYVSDDQFVKKSSIVSCLDANHFFFVLRHVEADSGIFVKKLGPKFKIFVAIKRKFKYSWKGPFSSRSSKFDSPCLKEEFFWYLKHFLFLSCSHFLALQKHFGSGYFTSDNLVCFV